MAADAKPEILIRNGRKSGKPTFSASVTSPIYESAWLCAISLVAAATCRSPKSAAVQIYVGKLSGSGYLPGLNLSRCRLSNYIGDRLEEIIDAEKLSGWPVRLVPSPVTASSVKLLFKELVREVPSKV